MTDEARRESRLGRVVREETGELRVGRRVLALASRLLPLQVGNEWRAALLRQAGFSVGPGTILRGQPNVTGGAKLTMGSDCVIDVDCTFDLGAEITIGDRVTIGHQAMLLTTSHELGPREHRCGEITLRPVIVGSGAWIGPRCVILPGVTIGAGAVVTAGSTVNKDVAPNTRVAGVPARPVETLSP
jgi:maltose O-acetyltransferase